MSWPTINEEAWDRFEEQEDLEAEREMHRRDREFFNTLADNQLRQREDISTITYSDGTVEIIERGIIQPNIDELIANGVIAELQVLGPIIREEK